MHESASCRSKFGCTTVSHRHTHSNVHVRVHVHNTWAHTQTQTILVKYTNENVAVLGQLGHQQNNGLQHICLRISPCSRYSV